MGRKTTDLHFPNLGIKGSRVTEGKRLQPFVVQAIAIQILHHGGLQMNILFYEKSQRLLLGVFAVGIILITAIPLYAAQVTLAWEKPNDDRITGYRVYCGISGTNFKSSPVQTVNSSDTTSCTITNLEEGIEYSFAATSFDNNGNESTFTDTINYTTNSIGNADNDGDGYSSNQGDCNDSDAAANPSSSEICGDGIDQDCNGRDLNCAAGPGTKTMVFGNTPDASLTGTVQDTFINLNSEVNASAPQLSTYTWPQNQPANAVGMFNFE